MRWSTCWSSKPVRASLRLLQPCCPPECLPEAAAIAGAVALARTRGGIGIQLAQYGFEVFVRVVQQLAGQPLCRRIEHQPFMNEVVGEARRA